MNYYRVLMYYCQLIKQKSILLKGNPELAAWFQAVDSDRSGRISAGELQQALSNGRCGRFSVQACTTLITMFDRDNSGTVDFNEFQQMYGFINQWRAAFQMYDRDNSQAIDSHELGQALTQMGYRFSPPTIETICRKFAAPGTRQITFDNFIVACVRLNNLTSSVSFTYSFFTCLITTPNR